MSPRTAARALGPAVRAGEWAELIAHWAHARRDGDVEILAATVTNRSGGRRIEVAVRLPAGGWAPTRTVAYSDEAVRMLRRQVPTPAARSVGGGR